MARAGSIAELLEPWRTRAAPALRHASVGVGSAALVAGVLLARQGSLWSRACAVAFWFLAGAAPLVLRATERRRERDPKRVLASTVLKTEPELGRAALRAYSLFERTASRDDTGSPELAALHVGRVLGRTNLERLVERAERFALRASVVGAALALAAFAVVAPDPFKLVEGLDVLAARRGVAPLPLEWLDDVVLFAEAPAYLGGATDVLAPPVVAPLAVGSIITVRARTLHEGRTLFLTDGRREVAFQDDGQGGVVASWVVDADATLEVAARFGAVRIPEPRRLEIAAVLDRTPAVRVENAPGTMKLLEHPRIPIHWEAFDDHALSEVQLVLRAGEREERRDLSKPQGAVDRGGIDVLAHDKFIGKSYVPVEITVEARDNDAIRGPKWGRSAPLVLVPPQVGELEVLRIEALVAARDALTDLFATRVEAAPSLDRAWLNAQEKQQRAVVQRIEEALKRDFGGLKVPGRVSAAARGQLERLDAALRALAKTPTKPLEQALRETTENTLLGLDAIIDALGTRDTRAAALKLADVASSASLAIQLGREPGERERAKLRLDAALSVLRGGGKNLVALSDLGRDLGEIVESDLGRIDRAMGEADRYHARLAADDLATRLRQPDPSFGSSGSGSMGGTEAGGAAQDGAASDAASDASGLEQALDELRREHSEEMAAVERALDGALSDEEKQSAREQLRKLAEKTRQAVQDLPEQGADPQSARSEAAQARSQAEGMAAALERGDLGEASENGKRALEALERAGKRAGEAPRGTSDHDVAGGARSASAKLKGLVDEAEKELAESRKKASENAKSALEKAADRERKLAERAKQLRDQSESSEAPLPEEMREKLERAADQMDAAAKELAAHRGAKGLDAQRQAQRLLEMAQPEKDPHEGEAHGQSRDGQELAQDADVPDERKDESAERFRRRVTEGLGRKAPSRLRDAVRRYTEGLLR